MVSDIKRWLEGEPVQARAYQSARLWQKVWTKRRYILAPLVVYVAVLTVVYFTADEVMFLPRPTAIRRT